MYARISSVFDRAQSSRTVHRAQFKALKRIHQDTISRDKSSEFDLEFLKCCTHFLQAERLHRGADNIATFLELYGSELSQLDDEVWSEFLERMLLTVLPGFQASSKTVRFRSAQLVRAFALNLTDETYQKLCRELLERLRDRDPHVRREMCLLASNIVGSEEQFDEQARDIADELIERSEHDPSAEVRRRAATNVPMRREYLNKAFRRVRDVNHTNRVAMLKFLNRIEDFRVLSIETRENVLKSGLWDSSEDIRKLAALVFRKIWLHQVDNDLIELLIRLDVPNSQVITREALRTLFDAKQEVLSDFTFGEEYWSRLGPETAFLLRCYFEYCKDKGLEELCDERMPELSFLAGEISRFWQACLVAEDSEQASNLHFVVLQLLGVARRYDFGDEAGRRHLTETLTGILVSSNPPPLAVVEACMYIFKDMAESTSQFVLQTSYLVNDIWDIDFATQQVTEAFGATLDIIESTLRLLTEPLDAVTYPVVNGMIENPVRHALESPIDEMFLQGRRIEGLLALVSPSQAEGVFDEFCRSLRALVRDPGSSTKELIVHINVLSDLLLTYDMLPSTSCASELIELIQRDDDPEIQAAACLVAAKLYLSARLTNPTHLKELMKLYFASSARSDPSYNRIKQQLTVFANSFSVRPENHEILAEMAVDIFLWISENPEEVNVKPQFALDMFIELTADENHKAHVLLADLILVALERKRDDLPRTTCVSLVSALNRLNLDPNMEPSLIRELLKRIPDLAEEPISLQKPYSKFKLTLESMLAGEHPPAPSLHTPNDEVLTGVQDEGLSASEGADED